MSRFLNIVITKSDLGDRPCLEDITDHQIGYSFGMPDRIGRIQDHFVSLYDGHGGIAAALYAFDHLWNNISFTKEFKSDKPCQIVAGINEGFARTQLGLSESLKAGNDKSGTTVACAILRGDLAYFANSGDSGIVVGKLYNGNIHAEIVSENHRPCNVDEMARIKKLGGVIKSNRVTHPSLHLPDDDKTMPRLNLTRGLGDVWSYLTDDRGGGEYLISPVPHVSVYHINPDIHKFILLASDGLLDVFGAKDCVKFIYDMAGDDNCMTADDAMVIARALIQKGLDKWKEKGSSADNISVVICFFSNSEW